MPVRRDGQDVFKMAFTLYSTELLAIENADTASSLTLVCSEAQVVCNYFGVKNLGTRQFGICNREKNSLYIIYFHRP